MTDQNLPDGPVPPIPGMPPTAGKRRRWVLPVVVGAFGVTIALVGSLVVLPAILDHDGVADAARTAAPLNSTGTTAKPSDTATAGTAPAITPTAAPTIAPFVSREGGFRIQLPSVPKKATAAQLGGSPPEGSVAYVAGDGVQSYTVTAVPMPCQPPEGEVATGLKELTANGITGVARGLNAKSEVLSETAREVDGHAAAQSDFTLTVGSLKMKGRMISAIGGKHVYSLTAMATEPDLLAWDKVIDSFETLDAVSGLPACKG
ncbi:hypothetical protein [Specibacter cremeus]|uniref:hypothetical protein n=1 Tax=Specibacter cremeus TaxID=1629051 RepID=UPI000F7795A1|nr:hypothetical protein [Specibacter cremeus]